MLCSTLKKKLLEASDCNFGELFESFQQLYDLLWFNSFLGFPIIPFDQELEVINPNNSQHTFSDNSLDTTPSSVSHRICRKRSDVTLVLDLDETLIHSSTFPRDADFTFTMMSKGEASTVYVRKRPFLEEFLEKVAEMFEVVIFTASRSSYSATLLDILDPHNKLFARRFYRDSCKREDGHCLKDLTVLGIDMAKVFIIDNSPGVFRLHVNNGIPIKSWYGECPDYALIDLLPFLKKLVDVDDVRPIIAAKFWKKFNSAHSSPAPLPIRRI